VVEVRRELEPFIDEEILLEMISMKEIFENKATDLASITYSLFVIW